MRLDAAPLEAEEQATFVQWLELVGLRFSALPLSTYTKSWKQKAFNHAQGVRAGVPDMVVLINPERSRDGAGHVLWIEMKRVSGGVVSAEQKAWIAALSGIASPNVHAEVCHGCHEAMAFVQHYLRPEPVDRSPF